MLKDITLGQYFPGDTVAHRLDPRTKLLLVIIYIVGLFNAVGWASYAFVILITALSMAISKIKPKSALKGLKPLVIIIILTAVLNIFYTGGTPIIEGWIITWEGIARAVMMSLRIILLIVGTFMLTYTTSPIALTDGLEIMLNPLKKIKIPVHEMSMMMSMALRFIPTLIEETDKIMSAQKARGADFDSGNLFRRAKALLPILVPLFVSAFRRADELAVAMESRCYHGWQVQKNDVSVCSTVQDALAKICEHPVKLTGCGRTDAGVHALRYCANFRTDCRIPIDRFALAANSRLPDDIAVVDAVEVDERFNSISSCIKKEYIYKIHNSNIRDPFLEKRACFYPQELDMERMQAASAAFEGTHDFAAVRSLGTQTKTTVRTVYSCTAEKTDDLITVSVCANGFLYNMCRAIVGTLVYASYGKIEPEDIPKLLELGDRRLTGPTMPPQGLYLNRVWYEGPAGIMMLKD